MGRKAACFCDRGPNVTRLAAGQGDSPHGPMSGFCLRLFDNRLN
jgi:hypothetical protein